MEMALSPTVAMMGSLPRRASMNGMPKTDAAPKEVKMPANRGTRPGSPDRAAARVR